MEYGELIELGRHRLMCADCTNYEDIKKLIGDTEVDLVLTDPPYGTINGMGLDGYKNMRTDWDCEIAPEIFYEISNKILRLKGVLILFSQEPYTSRLRTETIGNLPFTYPLIWEKDHFANSLLCKKAPVSYFEDINIFRKKYDSNNKNPLRKYSQNLLNYIGVSSKEIEKILGHRRAEHFFYWNTSQFGLCTEETYNELIDKFSINKYSNFKSYDELKSINNVFNNPIFNLPNDSKFKSNILKYSKDYERLHPTQKPVVLLEDLILTYTNPGDIVVDFCGGSGSTLIACENTNRTCYMMELNPEYCELIIERYNDYVDNEQTILDNI